jgi:phosphate:Na+ symporter
MTSEQGEELFNLRSVGRDIVEAIKDTKHLHKNLSAYIISDNQYIRDEYNKIRINLMSVLRGLDEAREGGGDILSLDTLKLEMKLNDTTANGSLEKLIHESRISAQMATSLMNDTSYAQDVIKNLLQMGEVLFATGDLNMKLAERSLALNEDEMQQIMESQQDTKN